MDVVMLWIAIIASPVGSGFVLRSTGRRFRWPGMTLCIAAVTLLISTLGNLSPGVLDALKRDGSQLAGGQLWRIVTPLLVQDGGWAGTIFNTGALLVLGTFVESLYHRRPYGVVYGVAGVVSEIFAYTFLKHQGFAGNSVAILGLAGLLGVTCVRFGPLAARIAGGFALVAGIGLVVTANLHGIGFAVGAVASALVMPRQVAPSTSGPVASNGR